MPTSETKVKILIVDGPFRQQRAPASDLGPESLRAIGTSPSARQIGSQADVRHWLCDVENKGRGRNALVANPLITTGPACHPDPAERPKQIVSRPAGQHGSGRNWRLSRQVHRIGDQEDFGGRSGKQFIGRDNRWSRRRHVPVDVLGTQAVGNGTASKHPAGFVKFRSPRLTEAGPRRCSRKIRALVTDLGIGPGFPVDRLGPGAKRHAGSILTLNRTLAPDQTQDEPGGEHAQQGQSGRTIHSLVLCFPGPAARTSVAPQLAHASARRPNRGRRRLYRLRSQVGLNLFCRFSGL